MTCGGGADIQKLLNKDRAKVLDFLNLIGRSAAPNFSTKDYKDREIEFRQRERTYGD